MGLTQTQLCVLILFLAGPFVASKKMSNSNRKSPQPLSGGLAGAVAERFPFLASVLVYVLLEGREEACTFVSPGPRRGLVHTGCLINTKREKAEEAKTPSSQKMGVSLRCPPFACCLQAAGHSRLAS